MRVCALLFGIAATLGASPAAAAEYTDVARLSLIAKGSVTVQRGDDQKQLAATVNTPLLPGDYVATAPDTLAEIQLNGLSMLRLGQNVQLRIANNDATAREVQLAQGTLILSIAHPQESIAEIDTPSVTLRASAAGDYRITVTPGGATLATARSGQAQILTPQRSYPLDAGQTLTASGSAANPTVTPAAEVALDALDAFNLARDRMVDTALDTDTYLPANIAGYDDLNAYGNWINVAPYGMVWNPYVPAGWAPYRYGSWVWEDGFGWTWIALEPWGWAPFHYGYWFYCAPNGWCWYPGLGLQPIWYPAVVGWFGFGSYWGALLGWQYWGWVPLWPFEPYYPWYPGWGGWHWHPYLPPPPPPPPPRRITTSPPHLPTPLVPVRTRAVHGTEIKTAYRNMPFGATGVSGDAFRAGNFSKLAPIDPSHLTSVTLMHGALPMTPTAANLQFTHSAPKTTVRWAPIFSESRFETSTGLPRRTPFVTQQQQMHQAIHLQSHEVTPAKPQTPPASQVWQQFENARRNITIPHSLEPHPYQNPVSAPAVPPPHVPPPAPHSAAPPAPHPAPAGRPPATLDWRGFGPNGATV